MRDNKESNSQEKPTYKTFDEWHKAFDLHLDSCHQCRTQCFNLCPTGAKILTNPPQGLGLMPFGR